VPPTGRAFRRRPRTIVAIQAGRVAIRKISSFNINIESNRQSLHSSPRKAGVSGTRPTSQSERDWAYVKNALANGVDPEELINQLAHSREADKSDPQYYARLTVTKAVADTGTHSDAIPNTSEAGNHRYGH
jgi:hypothetical protein